MTTKYASGRFCSVQCSNSRVHTQESVEKMKKTLADTLVKKKEGAVVLVSRHNQIRG